MSATTETRKKYVRQPKINRFGIATTRNAVFSYVPPQFLESTSADVTFALRPALKPRNSRLLKEDNVLSHAQDAVRGTTAESAGTLMTGNATALASDELLGVILTSLDESKAEEIVKIDLRGKSEMADWMVIATGRSSRQVAAIAENLVDKLKQNHGRLSKIEGKDTGDWVLIDVGDAIVHVFRPEVREFYQLEKMWLSPGDATTSPS